MAKAAATFAAAPSRTPAAPAAAKPRGGWLQGLVCGIALTFAPAYALALLVLLAPVVVAATLERGRPRRVARAMALCALPACFAPGFALWHEGGGVAHGFALAFAPRTLVLAWSAAAGGWLLTEILPLFLQLGLDATSLADSRALKAERARLLAEWDLGEGDEAG